MQYRLASDHHGHLRPDEVRGAAVAGEAGDASAACQNEPKGVVGDALVGDGLQRLLVRRVELVESLLRLG